MLFLAMSCFQGRTQDDAFERLTNLRPDGLQLTPGNLPSDGFRERVARRNCPTAFHHGFAWDSYRVKVYDGDDLVIDPTNRSVHPPKNSATFRPWLENMASRGVVVEIMYPGYALGYGSQIEEAMEIGLRLAVDISHLYIQVYQGVVSPITIKRLLDYEKIVEVHISESDGRADQHKPITPEVPFLNWALDRQRAGTLTVLESYFHRLSDDQQQRQIDQVRV